MNISNKNEKERDVLIFGEHNKEKYGGGIRCYDALTSEQLKELHNSGFLDLETCQNYSPSIGEFIEFMENHDNFVAHGYVVSVERDDYRVSVEGIKKEGDISEQDIIDFATFARYADDFICDKENFIAGGISLKIKEDTIWDGLHTMQIITKVERLTVRQNAMLTGKKG